VKKTAAVILAVVTLAAMGCKKQEEAPKGIAPQGGMPAQQMPAQQMPAQQMPAQQMPMPTGAAPGGNPHAGLKPAEIPAGVGHKGKVVSTVNAAGYTYVEVDEKGQKMWIATMETKVNTGDIVEFPETSPMLNFQSKSLKRTFDKIYFVPGIRISN